MHTSRRGEGRECGQLCYGPSRLRAVRGYYPYLKVLPPIHAYQCLAMAFSHASFHTVSSCLSSHRKSYCRWSVHLRAKGRAIGGLREPSASLQPRVAWLVGPSALLHEGGWGYAQGKLEILIALDRDRADLAAHDRMRDLARTAHPRAGRRRTWDRGAARGGAGRRRAARGGVAGRRTLQGRSSREYRT